MWILAFGIWALPAAWLVGPHVLIKAFLSLSVLAVFYLGRAAWRVSEGYEFQVDTSRRELRSTVLSSKGKSRLQASARFDQIIDPVMQRGQANPGMRSLSLRVMGRPDVMPVATGDERILLAVYDRLMRDLRPMEECVAGFARNVTKTPRPGVGVFPRLGPDEIAA